MSRRGGRGGGREGGRETVSVLWDQLSTFVKCIIIAGKCLYLYTVHIQFYLLPPSPFLLPSFPPSPPPPPPYILLLSYLLPSPCRYEKCHVCYSHLVVLRQEAERVVRESGGKAAKVIRDSAILDNFSVLD